MSETPNLAQKIEGSEVLDPRIYGRMATALGELATGIDRRGKFMLSSLLTAEEDLEESRDLDDVELGDYAEHGTVEGEGWVRFAWFDEAARATLGRYLGDEAESLRGQMEFAREIPGASLHGVLRLYEYASGQGHANARLFASGHMDDDAIEDPSIAQAFTAYVNEYGLESIWSTIKNSPLPMAMEGHITPRLGWSFVHALEKQAHPGAS